jgi:hypothetical protein
MTQLHEHLRASIENVEASIDVQRKIRQVGERPLAPARAGDQPTRGHLIAAIVIVVVGLGAAAMWMTAPGRSDPGTSSYAQSRAAESTPDAFDLALTQLKGRSALPAERPPDLAHVILTVGNGEQVLRIQLEDAMILVCGPTPCGEHTAELRRVTVNGIDFRILAAPLSKTAIEPPELAPEERSFWERVNFGSGRPTWLTSDLFPARTGSGG